MTIKIPFFLLSRKGSSLIHIMFISLRDKMCAKIARQIHKRFPFTGKGGTSVHWAKPMSPHKWFGKKCKGLGIYMTIKIPFFLLSRKGSSLIHIMFISLRDRMCAKIARQIHKIFPFTGKGGTSVHRAKPMSPYKWFWKECRGLVNSHAQPFFFLFFFFKKSDRPMDSPLFSW